MRIPECDLGIPATGSDTDKKARYEKDIRWEQRFSNFVKALRKLSEAVNYIKQKEVQDDLGNSNTIELVDEIIREGNLFKGHRP
ncbi:MAG: hypothetical protein JJU34_14485 [Lunatimonas sp.]|uniref:hypothetical protein n=1 Tax=Lunatimonas sp. TaxID=2060141 RepID=UPI00263BCDD1|nr:hypothetical protein [Lunatimonas sp.]MCC5938483.1 hypothetical protein [Lunatimonas sp.]